MKRREKREYYLQNRTDDWTVHLLIYIQKFASSDADLQQKGHLPLNLKQSSYSVSTSEQNRTEQKAIFPQRHHLQKFLNFVVNFARVRMIFFENFDIFYY